MKNYYPFIILCLFALFSCQNEDDGLVPIEIETQADTVSVFQNSEVDIFIFSNDTNIPINGSLIIGNPNKGTATIIDGNSTPNNPSDDYVKFTVNPNETGLDSFEYTVCDSSNNCKTETVSIEITSNSVVAFNLDSMPYQTLSEYNLFEGELKNQEPTFGVVPYVLNSKLFTDYAKKKRFIWLPNNTKASYADDNSILDFPVGAIIVKNFYYDDVLPNLETKIIETRIMIKKQSGWIFAEYVWNEAQTEATLDNNGSFVNLEWIQNGETLSTNYRVPSEAECLTCHKISEVPKLIGPKPRNLNLVYTYEDGSSNQLDKLVEIGYLENNLPGTIPVTPDYTDESIDLELRVRGYLDINCAHCHADDTHCDYRPMRMAFQDTSNLTNIGVCVDPDTDLGEDLGHIVEPGDSRNSVLHFRINSTEESNRMPLLGRTIVHAEGVALIEEWIDSLTDNCN
ncbi:MAG: Ig-like domain-containing protein [Bacteroidota bacterium]